MSPIQSIPEGEPSNSNIISSSKVPPREGVVSYQDEGASMVPSKQLSMVSSMYDVGGKGFLTPAEQKLREMDTDNQGQLSNEQVSKIVEQTMALRQVNNRLRMWVLALFVAVIVLGLSNIGIAFAAARLAKDTSVDESTGQMSVKGSNTAVITIAAGQSSVVREETDEDGNKFFCMKQATVALMMRNVVQGMSLSIVVETDDGSYTYGLAAGGSGYDPSRVCLGTTANGVSLCHNNTMDLCGTSGRRRLLSADEALQKHQNFKRSLNGLLDQIGGGGGDSGDTMSFEKTSSA